MVVFVTQSPDPISGDSTVYHSNELRDPFLRYARAPTLLHIRIHCDDSKYLTVITVNFTVVITVTSGLTVITVNY